MWLAILVSLCLVDQRWPRREGERGREREGEEEGEGREKARERERKRGWRENIITTHQ